MSQVLKPKKGYKRVTLLPKHIIINIPKEWKIEIMENLLIEKIQNGINIKLENYGKGFPILEIESLYKSDIIIKQSDLRLVSIENMNNYEQYKLKENDFVINRVSKVKEGVGKCVLVVNPIKNLLYEGNMIRVRIDNKQMNPMFLALLTKSNLYFKYIQSTCKTTSLTSIDQGIIEKIPIIIPPIQEQQKIATILSNLGNLISSTQKIINQTKSLKKGLMQKLLTRGIDHKKFKKVKWYFGKEIEIPAEWNITGIFDICHDIFLGLTTKVDYVETNGIPLIRANNISDGIFSLDNARFISKKQHLFLTRYHKPQLNDVLVTKSGSLGVCAIVDTVKEFSIYESIIDLQPNHALLDSQFLLYLLRENEVQNKLKSDTVGSTIGHINLTDFRKLKIPLSSLPEQQKIASILSNIDSQIQSQTKFKEKLERLKKSLMQKLLTGEVRVKT